MLISPGRRVVRRVTSRHRPWPGCRAPTNPPSRRARPSRSRMARAHRTPRREGLRGTGWSGDLKARRDPADASLTTGCATRTAGRRRARGGAVDVRVALGGWLELATGPRWTPPAIPPVDRWAAHPPTPCAVVRSRAPVRRPCPPPRVVPPAAADAWHAVHWTNSRQSAETAQAAGPARRPPAAVRPG